MKMQTKKVHRFQVNDDEAVRKIWLYELLDTFLLRAWRKRTRFTELKMAYFTDA
jgi:hypothetical protein